MTDIIVSGLSIYPVKSCREIKQKFTFVGNFGIENDRRWMVVDENGVMLTQRKYSEMCLIHVALTDSGIELNKANKESLFVKNPINNKKMSVKVWHEQCQAYDAGDEAANWLSEALSVTCRLVYFPRDEVRQIDLNYAKQGEKTAFSDGFPILLISEASLADLNARLDTPVTMQRFRPNIIVSGCEPFAEDNWKEIRVGEINYRIVKPCSRCAIPNINIDTAVREREPIKTLSSYRKHESNIYFGQNVIANSQGKLDVGMEVKIIE